MSRQKIEKIRKQLSAAEKRRSQIMSELRSVRTMLRGSYALVHTRCGKDNCWCKDGNGHEHPRLSWTEKGQGVTRKIPRDQIAWIQNVTARYRHFRVLRRKLVELGTETEQLLDALQAELIERTRSHKSFLCTKGLNRKKK